MERKIIDERILTTIERSTRGALGEQVRLLTDEVRRLWKREAEYVERGAVLVVLYPRGTCEVYAHRDVGVKAVTAPNFSAAYEVQAEKIIEKRAGSFKDLFWPNLLRARLSPDTRTAGELLDTEHAIEFIRTAQLIGGKR